MALAGKVCVVTGATSGIGASLVSYFAQEGGKVVFSGRREGQGKEVESRLKSAGGEATFVKADVTSDADMAALFETAVSTYGGVNFVCANAGIEGPLGPLADANVDEVGDLVFGINVVGCMRTMKAAIPELEKVGRGSIFVTSSVLSCLPAPNLAVYGASKAAVDSLVRSVALEVADKNIKVYSINPYVFDTEMVGRLKGEMGVSTAAELAKFSNPSGRAGKGESIAEFIIKVMAGETAYESGSAIACDSDAQFPLAEVPKKAADMAAAASG